MAIGWSLTIYSRRASVEFSVEIERVGVVYTFFFKLTDKSLIDLVAYLTFFCFRFFFLYLTPKINVSFNCHSNLVFFFLFLESSGCVSFSKSSRRGLLFHYTPIFVSVPRLTGRN